MKRSSGGYTPAEQHAESRQPVEESGATETQERQVIESRVHDCDYALGKVVATSLDYVNMFSNFSGLLSSLLSSSYKADTIMTTFNFTYKT